MLPVDFTAYTRQLMGAELYSQLEQGLAEEAPVSVRLNPFKVSPHLDGGEAVPWCSMGYYLNGRPAFTFDPFLHAGLYYVQEASSMFVCEAVRQCLPMLGLEQEGAFHGQVLDLCAAPGGKSTALRSVLPYGALLFSNEPVKTRASVLKENIIKFGHPDTIVTNNFPRDYQRAGLSFDMIVADVPCSGEGMFRKDAGAIAEWSPGNVEKCWQLQRSIIEDIWPCLRAGGVLIYSTCTFNAHEDEENVAWIATTLGADFVELKTRPEWNITGPLTGSSPCYRFIPGRTRGEGFFMAVLRKRGDNPRRGPVALSSKRKDRQQGAPSRNEHAALWLDGDFVEAEDRGCLRAIPAWWQPLYSRVRELLHVVHAGVGLGMMKGRDLIPDASLALSTALKWSAFPQVDLTYADAVRFLHKEAVVLPADTPRGFVLVSYRRQPLGFEKNIGNRANNLYPQEWKIKSTHLPDSASSLPCRPITR